MSVKLMDRVFEMDLDTTLKFVLLVMADAAHHDGSSSFPKVSTICKMTSLSESPVRKALAKLRALGYLKIETASSRSRGTAYSVNIFSPVPETPVPETPVSGATLPCPKNQIDLSQEPKNGHVSLLNRPLTVSEPSKEAPAAPGIVPAAIWLDFVETRRKIRKPLTARASELIRQELEKLKEQGHDPVEVLEQSIRNGWQDVFPIRGAQNGSGKIHTRDDERRARNAAAFAEVFGSPASKSRPVQRGLPAGTQPSGNGRVP